jgi:hypothetical protein
MRHAAIAGILVGLTSCAGARTTDAPGAPSGTLAERIESLRPMLGRWRAEARDPTSGNEFVLDYTVTPAVDGAWLVGEGRVESMDLSIHDLWGVDSTSGEIVRVLFDSTGLWGTVRSPGWTGDRGEILRLEGDVHAAEQRIRVRETITRVGSDELGAIWESEQDGTWTAYSVETLRRR